MPAPGAVAFGVVLSGALAALALLFLLRERRPAVVAAAVAAAASGPLAWDLVLRHTGGDFFVDAPGYVFPVSYEDAGSGVLALALATLLLGLGPMAREGGRRLAVVASTCGLAALLVDVYLY